MDVKIIKGPCKIYPVPDQHAGPVVCTRKGKVVDILHFTVETLDIVETVYLQNSKISRFLHRRITEKEPETIEDFSNLFQHSYILENIGKQNRFLIGRLQKACTHPMLKKEFEHFLKSTLTNMKDFMDPDKGGYALKRTKAGKKIVYLHKKAQREKAR